MVEGALRPRCACSAPSVSFADTSPALRGRIWPPTADVAMTTARPRLTERRRRRFATAPWAALAEIAARTGYVARGSVYISIGVVAVLAAAGLTPKAQGALGALAAWGAWPPAVALIWLIGLGLYGFAGWRALQALLDADTLGRTPKALAARAGQAVSGLVYGALAVSVFGFLDAIEDLHEADDQAKTAAFIAQLLALPAGEWLVMAAGAFILAAGIGNAVRALFGHFVRNLKCDEDTARWVGFLARGGYFSRGVAFVAAGAFTLRAGWHARAADARSVGGVLEALKHQPNGKVAMVMLALGFVAFGLFAFVEAWHRPIHPEGRAC